MDKIDKKEIAENTLFNTELKMGEDIVWNLQLLDKCKNNACRKNMVFILCE